jgi:hypothetical protein
MGMKMSEVEVQVWLDFITIPSTETFRREGYRKTYNVEDKIRIANAPLF